MTHIRTKRGNMIQKDDNGAVGTDTRITLAMSRQLLKAITRAQSEFITELDVRALFDGLLENLLAITQSEYGFIGEVFFDPEGSPYLKTHAITNIAWNDETRRFYEENAPSGLEFRNLNTLFGAVLTTREPVIANHPDSDPRAGGRPPGHPPLKAFLGLPFFQGQTFIGMVGVANRPGGYDRGLADFLKPFLSTCSNIIQAYRLELKRQQTEKSLRYSEAKNRAILDTVISGILAIDKDRIVREFNPGAERIFGYAANEIIGQNVKMLMPEPYHVRHDGYVRRYLDTGEKRIIGIGREVVGKRKDGTTFPLELAVNEMVLKDERMFVGVLTDITARKRAEEVLVAAKEAAEEANRLKSEFINVVSHELRTPLTVIIGNIPLLVDPEDLPDSEEIAEIARDIQEDSGHLLKLINDLLDISKLEAGKMQLHPERLSVPVLVRTVAESIRPLIERKGVSLDVDSAEGVIEVDPTRMKQILLNLLGNAVKFTDEGRISVKTYTKDDMVHVEVSDTGCGIKEEDLPLIFDVFKQVDSSSTRRASGTGLGLSITRRLVEMHGGWISAESRLDEGSTFTFTTPLAGEGRP